MSFLDNLKEEASFTETLNGAKTHASWEYPKVCVNLQTDVR